ncbi:hypothetical protein DFH09DRAFT_1081015 [Mycena vulgaris]|nr:hypothetical protein DFH09DRAFT_1081015 [Mycena vulgaris]
MNCHPLPHQDLNQLAGLKASTLVLSRLPVFVLGPGFVRTEFVGNTEGKNLRGAGRLCPVTMTGEVAHRIDKTRIGYRRQEDSEIRCNQRPGDAPVMCQPTCITSIYTSLPQAKIPGGGACVHREPEDRVPARRTRRSPTFATNRRRATAFLALVSTAFISNLKIVQAECITEPVQKRGLRFSRVYCHTS